MLVFVAVAAIVLLRLAVGGFDFDTVWAEDGRVFLRDVREHGLGSFWITHGGYLPTLQRLLSLPALVLPLRFFDLYAVLASTAVVAALAVFVHVAVKELTGSPEWALLPALGMAFVPAAGFEALGNIANTQWWLLPAAFAAFALPRQSPHRGVATVVAATAALTIPLTLLTLPAALVRGLDGLRSWPVAAALVGLVVQVAGILFGREPEQRVGREVGVPVGEVTYFFSGVLGTGSRADWAWLVGVVVLAGLVALFVTARSGRRIAGAAAASALLLFTVTAVLSGTAPRYQAAGAMILLIGVAALGRSVPLSAPVVGAVVAVLWLIGFPVSDTRTSGTPWSSWAEPGELACRMGAEDVDLAVAPAGWSEPFPVRC